MMRAVGLSLLSVLVLVAVGSAGIARGQCAHGDSDGSGVVDLSDYSAFVDCASTPPGEPVGGECGTVDFDGDDDVDVRDDGRFQAVFGVTLGVPFVNTQFGVERFPSAAATGDLDGDGDLDLAVTNVGPCRPLLPGTVSILLNQGDGAFADHGFYETGEDSRVSAIGDLDGDGDLDLATSNAASDNVSVLLNLGDGTIGDHVLYAAGDQPTSLSIGDLDGDGDLDVAAAKLARDDISVPLNDGRPRCARALTEGETHHWPNLRRVYAVASLRRPNTTDPAVANESAITSIPHSETVGIGPGTAMDISSSPKPGSSGNAPGAGRRMTVMTSPGDAKTAGQVSVRRSLRQTQSTLLQFAAKVPIGPVTLPQLPVHPSAGHSSPETLSSVGTSGQVRGTSLPQPVPPHSGEHAGQQQGSSQHSPTTGTVSIPRFRGTVAALNFSINT